MTGTQPPTGEGEPTEDHIDGLLDELTRAEKLALVRGQTDPEGLATGYLAGNDRVGIPPLSMVDGPMGIRALPSTAFPASIALAAAWDPDLAREFGRALAAEARGAGQDVLLAPGCNIVRVPQCGRAFEYYSEDPHLSARTAVGTIEGVQSGGVMATVKHFVANNQETDRHRVSANVSERALREIYLPAFEAAVTEADVAAVMAAYNRIGGIHATEHERLLTDVLRDEWGFEGFVVSDWWATTDGPAAAAAGLDLDMPGMPVYEWHVSDRLSFDAVAALPDRDWLPKRRLASKAVEPWQPPNPNPLVLDDSPFGEPLRTAVADGRVSPSTLDRMLRRVLGQMERFGLFDEDRPEGSLDDPEHHDLARRIAERGTVLLRNDEGALPLADGADVALIGPHADEAKVGGGGSSEVDPTRATDPLTGLRERAGVSGSVRFERGLPPVGDPSMHGSLLPDVSLPGGEDPRIEDAMRAAGDADVAVVAVRDLSSEGADRSLGLPGAQDELIAAVAAVAERTVVVLRTAGAVEMPWLDHVDAVVQSWYPGQEDGHALASVLYGDVDPSGRLPVTFGERASDYPAATAAQYPGVDHEADYSEGVFVGYRHFDAERTDPLFPFGHGRSYADFEYGDATVTVEEDGDGPTATVDVPVENVSDRSGREVVQVYVGPADAPVERPPRELAAFESLELDAGERETVSLSLGERAFAYYDEDGSGWTVEGGEYDVLVGRSSRDVRSRAAVDL